MGKLNLAEAKARESSIQTVTVPWSRKVLPKRTILLGFKKALIADNRKINIRTVVNFFGTETLFFKEIANIMLIIR